MVNDNKQDATEIQANQDGPELDVGLDAVAPAAAARPNAADSAQTAGAPRDITRLKVEKSCSRGLAGWLAQHRLSLAITSYQTGRIYLVGSDQQGRVSFFERIFERAMGVVGNAQRIYLGGLYQLWRFENVLRPNEIIHGQFDKCYVPRNAQTIGDLDIHELGIRKDGRVVFVNTKYSCLAELSPTHSFKAIWKPKFISKLAPEDRCHLNGLAMVDGEPKYVTAVCRSDSVDGWRERRRDGGVVIDVRDRRDRLRGPVDAALAALAQRQAVAAQRRHRPARLGGFREEGVRSARVRPRLRARAVDHRQRRRGGPVEAAQPALRGAAAGRRAEASAMPSRGAGCRSSRWPTATC